MLLVVKPALIVIGPILLENPVLAKYCDEIWPCVSHIYETKENSLRGSSPVFSFWPLGCKIIDQSWILAYG